MKGEHSRKMPWATHLYKLISNRGVDELKISSQKEGPKS